MYDMTDTNASSVITSLIHTASRISREVYWSVLERPMYEFVMITLSNDPVTVVSTTTNPLFQIDKFQEEDVTRYALHPSVCQSPVSKAFGVVTVNTSDRADMLKDTVPDTLCRYNLTKSPSSL